MATIQGRLSTDFFLADQFSIELLFEQNKVQRFSAED